jgi:hypothetical protein
MHGSPWLRASEVIRVRRRQINGLERLGRAIGVLIGVLEFAIPRKTLRLAGQEHGRAIPLADIGHLAYPRGAMVFEREYRMAQMSRFGWSISHPHRISSA